MFRFRFKVRFAQLPPYISSKTYGSRHECCEAAKEFIHSLKKTKPQMGARVFDWTYHGWVEGQAEPAWR